MKSKINNKIEERDSLVVMDFRSGKVSTYDWEGLDDDIETYIDEQGHSLNDCQWGVFKNKDIDLFYEPKIQKVPLKLSLEIFRTITDLAGGNVYDSDDENFIAEFDADVKILKDFIIEQY